MRRPAARAAALACLCCLAISSSLAEDPAGAIGAPPMETAAEKFAAANADAPTAPPPLSPADAATALSRVAQITLVRHGEHAHLDGVNTPCLSEVGVSRAGSLAAWARDPPRGVLARVDVVAAMNGTGGDPPSVRPIDSAVPAVLAFRVPHARFVRRWGQWDSLAAARAILDEGALPRHAGGRGGGGGGGGGDGSAVLVVWFHWGLVAILNALGVPTTGWNAQSLDAATTEAYNAAIVLTPHGAPRLGDGPNGTRVVLADPDPRAGVRVRLFRTPPIDRESLLPPSPDPDKEVVFFDETVPWAVVARQAGSVVRVVPVNETAGGAVGGKAPVVVERAEPAGQE